MADYMEFYSNSATLLFDQPVIYQHLCFFEKKLDFLTLMDDNFTPAKKRSRVEKTQQARKRIRPALDKDITQLQNTLDYLQDEWATIDIVLHSLKSAFTIHPAKMTTEEYLDEIDREMSIAFDDLMAQVRSLDRNLKRLDTKIKSCHASGPLV
jgi:enoyl-[acyl-carrier-protein] reductase (NADH)